MPNWCYNEVDISADPNIPKEFWEFLLKTELSTERARENAVDNDDYALFERLVPMPKQLRNTTGSSADGEFMSAMKGDKEYAYSSWYTWSLAHWGTKWDVHPTHADLIEDTLSLSFETAWSPANHVWEAVSKEFPSLDIRIRYLEEGMGFIGETRYKNGEEVVDLCLNISTKMYAAAGCTLNAEGDVDWDEDQNYNLFDLFDEGLEKWEEESV